jgi:cytochrome-b5 reductase
LIVKEYPTGGLSKYMSAMNVGDTLDFKHIPFNVKRQYPFNRSHVAMIAGGTGVTPMIQALHALLGSDEDVTKVTLLYGSRRKEDIIAREALEVWERMSGGRLKVVHVLSEEEGEWGGERGHIDKGIIEKYLPGKEQDVEIFVCGPEGMYGSLCGPRGEEGVDGILGEMGYGPDQVVKF